MTCACTAYSLLELSYQVERRVCDKLRGTLNFQHYARAHCCLWYAIRDICSCIYAPEDITASIGISWKHLPRKNTPVVPGYITQLSNTLEYSSPSLPASKRKIPTSWFDHNITSTSASTTGRKHSLEKPYQQSVHFISLHSQFGLIPVVFIKKPRSIQELWTSDPFSSVFWQLRWLCRRWRHLGHLHAIRCQILRQYLSNFQLSSSLSTLQLNRVRLQVAFYNTSFFHKCGEECFMTPLVSGT